jgi:L-alanine-DL-glutamate epimerase-like enolase superfamily enzyme
VGRHQLVIEAVEVGAYRVPTEAPESDGTLQWNSTIMVAVEVCADGARGLGYTYSHPAAAVLVRDELTRLVRGRDPMDVGAAWLAMAEVTRNLGTSGVVAAAISAVDTALWDLKARLLGVPLAALLGQIRQTVPVYGSSGFTSYGIDKLQRCLGQWVAAGIRRVKMKVGREPERDAERVRAARQAIGPDVELYVDANGAYTRKQALEMAERFAEQRVSWFEEPVSSDDIEGLRLIRDRAPAGMAVTTGEYGFGLYDFRDLLQAGAVDVLQADITRCKGLTGLLQVHALCEAWCIPLSTHTAPALHLHPGVSMNRTIHLEYFRDHVRLEALLLDGVPALRAGALAPNMTRTGNGLELRRKEAARYAV